MKAHLALDACDVPSLFQLVRSACVAAANFASRALAAQAPAYSKLNEGRLHADAERILRPFKLDTAQAADLVLFCTARARQRRAERQCEFRAASSSPGGVSAGTRKRSLAQAPRSAMRQRSLQNGRQRLLSA